MKGLPDSEILSVIGRLGSPQHSLFFILHTPGKIVGYTKSRKVLVVSKTGTFCLFFFGKGNNAVASSYRTNVCQLPIHYISLNFDNMWLWRLSLLLRLPIEVNSHIEM